MYVHDRRCRGLEALEQAALLMIIMGNLALVDYLNRFEFWRVVGDEDDPFLRAAAVAAAEPPPAAGETIPDG